MSDYGIDVEDPESLIMAVLDNGALGKSVFKALSDFGWQIVRADRIAALESRAEIAEADRDAARADFEAESATLDVYSADVDTLIARLTTLEADFARVSVAAEELLHAVCSDTGFAACVRADSGMAYPWPAMDIAADRLRAILAPIAECEQ